MSKLDNLWKVLEESLFRIKLEEAMEKAGYTPEEVKDLEDGDPELGRYLIRVFNDLRKATRSSKRLRLFVKTKDFYNLYLLRKKASHYALDELFNQYSIDWDKYEQKWAKR